MSFFIENLTLPLSVTVGDIAIMMPAEKLVLERRRMYLHTRTRLRIERAAHCKLNGQDGIAVSVTDPVATAIERAHIILRGSGPHEMIG